jgi:hypothetical protein
MRAIAAHRELALWGEECQDPLPLEFGKLVAEKASRNILMHICSNSRAQIQTNLDAIVEICIVQHHRAILAAAFADHKILVQS